MKHCLDCKRQVSDRNTKGRCMSCALKWAIATQPGMLAARRKAGKASIAKPGERERRSEMAKAQGLFLIGQAARTEESFKRTGRGVSAARMAWCPPHLRAEARFLTRDKRIPLAEVKEIILNQHAADMQRFRERIAA